MKCLIPTDKKKSAEDILLEAVLNIRAGIPEPVAYEKIINIVLEWYGVGLTIMDKTYKIANDVEFEVTETKEIQKVSMKDELVNGKIIIEKTDEDTKKGIAGVEFEIYTNLNILRVIKDVSSKNE